MKKYKDVCAVTEAAFPCPGMLTTPAVCNASCSPTEGPEISTSFSAKSANTSVLVMPCLPIFKESPIILDTQSCAAGQNVSICSARESSKRDMQRNRLLGKME